METTVIVEAVIPLNATLVALRKPTPDIATVVPIGPLPGVNPVTTGASGPTVKLVELEPIPPGPTTLTVPDVAPTGTVATATVSE